MSFPPPPGIQKAPQPQPHSSLPPRPPTTTHAPSSTGPSANAQRPNHAFTRFQPRSVAATPSYRPQSPATSTPYSQPGYSTPTAPYNPSYQYPQTQYQQPPQQSYQQQQQPNNYYSQQQYASNNYGQPTVAHQRNQYPQDQGNLSYGPGSGGYGRPGETSGVDLETEVQIAQWQSAYISKDDNAATGKPGIGRDATSATGANTGPLGNGQRLHDSSSAPNGAQTTSSASTPGHQSASGQLGSGKTVVRSGGGQTWTDQTLLEWDPAHFRLFCGNLAGEVTDDSLLKAFSKYPSVQKARVIRDKRTEKSKGYGFVSFSDGDDYFRAAREMQGKYIGSHPVLLRRAMTEIRPVTSGKGGKGQKKGGNGPGGGGGNTRFNGKGANGGVQKKQAKTKGGLKVLG